MGNLKFFDDAINKKLKDLHCAFLAKVLSVNENDNTAKIQPLGKIKQYDGKIKDQSILENVPIAVQRFKEQELNYVSGLTVVNNLVGVSAVTPNRSTINVLVKDTIKQGDIVVCVCCDRDITEARKGRNSVPAIGNIHSISDAVIVGVL